MVELLLALAAVAATTRWLAAVAASLGLPSLLVAFITALI